MIGSAKNRWDLRLHWLWTVWCTAMLNDGVHCFSLSGYLHSTCVCVDKWRCSCGSERGILLEHIRQNNGARCGTRYGDNCKYRWMLPTTASAAQAITLEVVNNESEGNNSLYGTKNDSPTVRVVRGTIAKAIPSSPRSWLESSPLGAYTVIRCDYHRPSDYSIQADRFESSSSPSRGYWTVWGLDFHLQRLRESFVALTSTTNTDFLNSNQTKSANKPTEFRSEYRSYMTDRRKDNTSDDLDRACYHTIAILRQLSRIVSPESTFQLDNNATTNPTTVFMLTVLWHSCISDHDRNIVATGHVSCIRNNVSEGKVVSPISMPLKWTLVVDVASGIVNRQAHPQPYAKVSSWCKERQTLEKCFMPQSELMTCHEGDNNLNGMALPVTVNEVILTQRLPSGTRDIPPHVHLLEGLTSNLFVVYPNNVIRTAGHGVLFGYARHLIFQAIESSSFHTDATVSSWKIDTTTPIRLEEANEWQEVFCTSSIRLIVPVDRILVPNDDGVCDSVSSYDGRSCVREIWCCKSDSHRQVWKKLLTYLLDSHHEKVILERNVI
jgi:hypothetical protein